VKHFYTVPTALLDVAKPVGPWHAMSCADDPTFSLVVVEAWNDHSAQDAWEAHPEVVEHHLEQMGQPVSRETARLHGRLGVATGMTHREAFRRIAAAWPVWRH